MLGELLQHLCGVIPRFFCFFLFLGGTTLCGTSFPIKRQNFAANKIKEDDKENGRMTQPEEEQNDDDVVGVWRRKGVFRGVTNCLLPM